MRILCVIDTFKIGGGAQTQMAGLATMLKSYGHDVVALSYYNNPPEVSFEPYLKESGVEYKCLDNAINIYDKLVGVKSVITEFNPDTVIAYIDGPTSICCLIKALGGNFRLIVSERNVTQNITFKERLKFHLYRFADVIVPNAYSQERFIKYRYPFLADKVCTISNFVDTEVFHPKEYADDCVKKTLEILIVARVNPQKNVLNFLLALDIVRSYNIEFHVDWYGNPTHGYYEKCISLVRNLNLNNNISFYDAIKNIDCIYTNDKYDVYCLPSLFEGCPNTLAEAMACGLPILCSDVCDNAMYVNSGVNGFLFNPKLPQDIANAILAFSKTNTKIRDKMGSNGRAIAQEKLSKKAFIAKYLNIINGCLL